MIKLIRITILWTLVFPVVLLLNKTLSIVTPDYGVLQRSAVMSGLLVPLISLLIVPVVNRLVLKIVK